MMSVQHNLNFSINDDEDTQLYPVQGGFTIPGSSIPSSLTSLLRPSPSDASPLPSEYEEEEVEEGEEEEPEEEEDEDEDAYNQLKKYVLNRDKDDHLVRRKWHLYKSELKKINKVEKDAKKALKKAIQRKIILKQNILSFLNDKNIMYDSPLKAFNKKYKCNICLYYKLGLNIIILNCSHYFCIDCFHKYTNSFCPTCREPILISYRVTQQGERLAIKSFPPNIIDLSNE